MPGTPVGSLAFPDGKIFEVSIHDILLEDTDCIVNAANGGLSHGGGVAAAISKAAGRKLDEEGYRIVAERGPIQVGEAVVTTAGDLPFKGVIHAVGPQFGEGDEENKIERALRSAFSRAHERKWGSLSFPGISSGIFAVPHQICARAYFKAVRTFWSDYPDSPLSLIRLVLFEGPLLEEIRRLL